MRVIFGVMICIFLAALDQTAVVPAIPAIAGDLGSYAGLSWVVAAYLITSTISTPCLWQALGYLRASTAPVTCLAVFITTFLSCAAAQSLGQLMWFRAPGPGRRWADGFDPGRHRRRRVPA
jgi:MFS family permease